LRFFPLFDVGTVLTRSKREYRIGALRPRQRPCACANQVLLLQLDAQIFKDPRTAGGRIYLTQAAKAIFETSIAENSLTGLRFFEAEKKF
jgi:hypothetical protein